MIKHTYKSLLWSRDVHVAFRLKNKVMKSSAFNNSETAGSMPVVVNVDGLRENTDMITLNL